MRSQRGADGLRAIACLMVIFHHLVQKLQLDSLNPRLHTIGNFLVTGSAGVSVFFVLSGFLLATPFWKNYLKGEPHPDMRGYAIRRSARIMPGFFLNLFVCFFLGLSLFPDAPAQIWRYLAGLTFTAGFHWLTFFPVEVNGPLWTISFEVFSYVLLALCMVGLFAFGGKQRSFAKGIIWWLGLLILICVGNYLIQNLVQIDNGGKGWQFGLVGGAKTWLPRYNPLGFFGHFAVGVLSAGLSVWWNTQTSQKNRSRLFDGISLACLGLWLGLLAFCTAQTEFEPDFPSQPYYFPAFAAVTALLLACLGQSNIMARLFDNRFFRFSARISYGLYLWHYIVIFAVQAVIAPGDLRLKITDLGEWFGLAGLTLVISYALAAGSWYFLEQPFLVWAKHWRPRPPGQPVLWTRFRVFVVIAVAVLVIVPPVVATILRPSAWTFPAPWFGTTTAEKIFPDQKGTIVVHISGAHSSQGNFLVSVFRAGGFDAVHTVASKSAPAGPDVTIQFSNLPYGVYAVAGMHDENNNKHMDMNGSIPLEGVIAPLSPIGPPDFETLKVVLTHPKLNLDLTVFYLQ